MLHRRFARFAATEATSHPGYRRPAKVSMSRHSRS